MTTIGIVGAGDLGGAVAHALARGDRVRRIVIVDPRGSIARGKALDIGQAGAIEPFGARLEGSDDHSRLIGCSVCVVADEAAGAVGTGEAGLTSLMTLARHVGSAPIVLAGSDAASLMTLAVREGGVSRDRLIGSASEAMVSAVKALVALEARCAPTEVGLVVLGRPPSGFVVPWNDVSIGGRAAERVLAQVQLTRLEARIARLWPLGPFALGAAAARVAEAVVSSSRRAHTVLSVLDGELGVRGRVGALPALLGPNGIIRREVPGLTGRDRVRLDSVLGA